MAATQEAEDDVEIAKMYDGVTFKRGLGESGKRSFLVERECDMCHHDRMVRKDVIKFDLPNTSEYYCQYPMCPNYHGGEVKNLGFIPQKSR